MSNPPFRIKTFGETALLLEWPAKVELETLWEILGFTDYLKQNHLPETRWEFIPVYHSLCLINRSGELDHAQISDQLKKWYEEYPKGRPYAKREWVLPVCYDPEFGLDLEESAARLEMTPEKLIELHTAQAYPVYGIGFLPGFVYLGGVPPSIQLQRRSQPRLKVSKGAVGLADRQTGIYPQDSPGGWNILGNCPIPLFDPERNPPCFVSLGDTVRFRAVSRAEYDLHRIEGEVGIYDFKKKYGNAAS